jgi:serine 3-dehydrogenase (NADP+)
VGEREETMPGKLEGKTAVIIGATSGMGRSTALLFAREGARLAIAGRRPGLLQELGEQIAAESGAPALGVPCDVTRRDQVRDLLQVARAQLGKIDSIVFAAGINVKNRDLGSLRPETWDEMIGINLTGAYHCTQLAVPVFREQQDGLIIYISSIAAISAGVSGIAYAASKCGLDGLADGTMAEEKQHGIRTSVIYPGVCDTPLLQQRPNPPTPEVLQHALQPEDVADACLFIAALPTRCHVPKLVLTTSRI